MFGKRVKGTTVGIVQVECRKAGSLSWNIQIGDSTYIRAVLSFKSPHMMPTRSHSLARLYRVEAITCHATDYTSLIIQFPQPHAIAIDTTSE